MYPYTKSFRIKNRIFRYRLLLSLLGILFFSVSISAQVYKEKGENRFTFAQSTIGYDFDLTPPGTGYSYIIQNGQKEKFDFSSTYTPTISISGLHFWGRAEFFTGFSLSNIFLGDENPPYTFSRSAGTGGKFYPFQIQIGKLVPYIGFSVSPFSYKKGDGTVYKRVEVPLLAGVTYCFSKGILDFGINYYYAHKHSYYANRTEQVELSLPPISFHLDYKYYHDFSLVSLKSLEDGAQEKLFQKLQKRRSLSSFTIAFGPAYSFYVGNSTYNSETRPYLDDYSISGIIPDLCLGYYWYAPDLQFNLAYRYSDYKLSAYQVKQEINRHALGIESFKFFGDYHGFVPFVGICLNYEWIRFREWENENPIHSINKEFVNPGIIVGWDIRPVRTDFWGLRTNIRYFPFMQLDVDQSSYLDLQQIELNFLQLIIYPNRLIAQFSK